MLGWIKRSIVERIVAAVYAFFGLDLPTCAPPVKDDPPTRRAGPTVTAFPKPAKPRSPVGPRPPSANR